MKLNELFNIKATENGDLAFNKASDNDLINILFMTEFYQKHLNAVPLLPITDQTQLFSMFIRDPRYGLGRRDLGRRLMSMTQVAIDNIIKAGRVDDVFHIEYEDTNEFSLVLDYLKTEIEKGNELVKKWMPRYSSKDKLLAREIAHYWGMNKQQYGKFIKCNTVENKLSTHRVDEIEFDKLPSLALLKYWNRFRTKEDTRERFSKYLEDVKSGKKDMKVSTTTVYDIFKNQDKVDADLVFSKIEKIKINAIPIVDTSGSMWNRNDSIGKALAIGHYLAKCSTYAPDKVISFSSNPQLLTLGKNVPRDAYGIANLDSTYNKEIRSMYTGDCSNTDFGAVMELLKGLTDMPEYLIVLSDMEFDYGSCQSKTELQQLWKEKGYTTKIVWWNLNERNTTAPEMDNNGNIYLSGYNPMLLKFLSTSFDAEAFLNKLLEEYKSAISK